MFSPIIKGEKVFFVTENHLESYEIVEREIRDNEIGYICSDEEETVWINREYLIRKKDYI